MKNYFKRLETGLIIVMILVLGVAYGVLNNKAKAPSHVNNQAGGTSEESQIPNEGNDVVPTVFSYEGVEGKTALELLKATFLVETQSFGDMGEFVTAINGVDADTSAQFWAFYLNGEQSQVGASTYVTKSTDKIEWRLEEIK